MSCLICKARVGSVSVRESASSCEVSTGDNEAVFRTHIQNAERFEWVDPDGVAKKKKQDFCPAFCTGICCAG